MDKINVAPNSRYRPRADVGLLSRLVQDAWQEQQDRLTSQQITLDVAEVVTGHLETRFPAADMALLAKYGVAKEVTSIGVRTYNADTKRWDHVVPVALTRPVLTPGAYGLAEVHAGGPRWSRDPNRGCKPDYWASITDAERAEIIAHQDADEARQLPESVEPFFCAVVAARHAYKAEYRQTVEWPTEVKQETGDYPTWGAIMARFPVLGAYVEARL